MRFCFAATLIISVLAISGCASQTQSGSSENNVMTPANESSATQSANQQSSSPYSGAVLAGKASPVIDFNPADYQAALQSNKLIVLYFYASWCPICRAEVPQMYSAFEELNNPNAIAFRVNFNDGQTDGSEIELARQFGVAYQHTKVFLRNGNQLLKSTESWDKNRYMFEINKALSA